MMVLNHAAGEMYVARNIRMQRKRYVIEMLLHLKGHYIEKDFDSLLIRM